MDKVHSVQVEVILNSKDLIRYIVHYYRKNVLLSLMSLIAVVLLIAALLDLLSFGDCISFLTHLDPLILILCAIILLLPVIIYFLLLSTGKNYGLLKKRVYKINMKEVVIRTNKKEIRFPVNSISRISETKNTLYIWQKNAPQILPKRYMSDTDIAFIRTLNK